MKGYYAVLRLLFGSIVCSIAIVCLFALMLFVMLSEKITTHSVQMSNSREELLYYGTVDNYVEFKGDKLSTLVAKADHPFAMSINGSVPISSTQNEYFMDNLDYSNLIRIDAPKLQTSTLYFTDKTVQLTIKGINIEAVKYRSSFTNEMILGIFSFSVCGIVISILWTFFIGRVYKIKYHEETIGYLYSLEIFFPTDVHKKHLEKEDPICWEVNGLKRWGHILRIENFTIELIYVHLGAKGDIYPIYFSQSRFFPKN